MKTTDAKELGWGLGTQYTDAVAQKDFKSPTISMVNWSVRRGCDIMGDNLACTSVTSSVRHHHYVLIQRYGTRFVPNWMLCVVFCAQRTALEATYGKTQDYAKRHSIRHEAMRRHTRHRDVKHDIYRDISSYRRDISVLNCRASFRFDVRRFQNIECRAALSRMTYGIQCGTNRTPYTTPLLQHFLSLVPTKNKDLNNCFLAF